MSTLLHTEDVIGLVLEEAQQRLSGAGLTIDVEKTYPTKRVSGNGRWRIIRQRREEGRFLLTAAEESAGVL